MIPVWIFQVNSDKMYFSVGTFFKKGKLKTSCQDILCKIQLSQSELALFFLNKEVEYLKYKRSQYMKNKKWGEEDMYI